MAIALFVVLVSLSMSSVLNVLDASRRVRGNKDVMDSLNASLEYMTRTVRFGHTYHCGGGTLTVAQNCTTGADLLATRFNSQTFVFNLSGGRIRVSDDGGVNYKWLTGSNVIIDQLQFFTFGTDKTDNIQPYVLTIIRGRVKDDAQSYSSFDIQTMMSQRKLDLNI